MVIHGQLWPQNLRGFLYTMGNCGLKTSEVFYIYHGQLWTQNL